MYCINCGKEIPDDTQFCMFCGIEQMTEEMNPVIVTEKEERHIGGTKKKRLMIAGAVIIAVILVIVFIAPRLLDARADVSNVIVYQSDDEIHVIKDFGTKKNTDLRLTMVGDAKDQNLLVGFDDSGENLFFFDKVSDNNEGRLCYITSQDMLKKEIDNDIKTIDSKVEMDSVHLVSGNRVVYFKNNVLYYFDGENSVKIAADVSRDNIYIDEENILYQKNSDIYYASLNDNLERNMVNKDVSEIYHLSPDFIVYEKKGNDLYVSDIQGNTNKIATDAKLMSDEILENDILDSEKESFWYLTNEKQQVPLYDLLEDDLLEQSQNADEADPVEYMIEVPEDVALSDYLEQSDGGSIEDFYTPENIELYKEYEGIPGYYSYYNYHDSQYYFLRLSDLTWHSLDENAYDRALRIADAEDEIKEFREYTKSLKLTIPYYSLGKFENGENRTICENVWKAYASYGIAIYSKIDVANMKIEKFSDLYNDYYDNIDSLENAEDIYDIFDDLGLQNAGDDSIYYVRGDEEEQILEETDFVLQIDDWTEIDDDALFALYSDGSGENLIAGIEHTFTEERYMCLRAYTVNENKLQDTKDIAEIGFFGVWGYYDGKLIYGMAESDEITGADLEDCLYGSGDWSDEIKLNLYSWDGKTTTCIASDISFESYDIWFDSQDALLYLNSDDQLVRYYDEHSDIIYNDPVTKVVSLTDGRILYLDEDNDLYLYSEGASVRVAYDVTDFVAPNTYDYSLIEE